MWNGSSPDGVDQAKKETIRKFIIREILEIFPRLLKTEKYREKQWKIEILR